MPKERMPNLTLCHGRDEFFQYTDLGNRVNCRLKLCEIHSDEWPAYGCLNTLGYIHQTVNHQRQYVDPVTGVHTQATKRSWLDAKIDILRKKRGIPARMLQSDLNYFCWKVLRKTEDDLFIAFLNDVRTIYAQ